jgi:hypothetical protein
MAGKLSYEQKKNVADTYLIDKAGVQWNDLADINSLHDAETAEEVCILCDERLQEDGFPE